MRKVQEICLDVKGKSSFKLDKARVKLNLVVSLKLGTFVNVEGLNISINFKYEPPRCKIVPYEESRLKENSKDKFG